MELEHSIVWGALLVRVDSGAVTEIDNSTWLANLERNPLAALMYGMSVVTCMSSSLSEPDGLGLGTLGLYEERIVAMTRDAGFRSVEPLDLGHPVNAFYIVRP